MKNNSGIQLVIFDLDGTLLDTIGDLGESCNAVLRQRGFPEHDLEVYRHFVGNGITRLIERALPETKRDPAFIAEVRADFVTYYSSHIDVHTHPYPGIAELLTSLTQSGMRVAVASNKFQSGTDQLIRRFFPHIDFVAVFGQREGVPLKPDPTVVNQILTLAKVGKEASLYVGDSGVDMKTSVAAGLHSVGVTWGFRGREELAENGAWRIVNQPSEIAALVSGSEN